MPAASPILSKIRKGGSSAIAASQELRHVIDRAGGVIGEIAERLEISRRSVFRLLTRAGLTDYALEARRRSGARSPRNGLVAPEE
jgi:hypothetical protein